MPTYEYHCSSCEKDSEAFQSINAEPLTKCPYCEQKSLKRLISGGATLFQFKGDGFYITDYKDQKPKPSEKK